MFRDPLPNEADPSPLGRGWSGGKGVILFETPKYFKPAFLVQSKQKIEKLSNSVGYIVLYVATQISKTRTLLEHLFLQLDDKIKNAETLSLMFAYEGRF